MLPSTLQYLPIKTETAYLACDSLTGVLPKQVAFMTCGNL